MAKPVFMTEESGDGRMIRQRMTADELLATLASVDIVASGQRCPDSIKHEGLPGIVAYLKVANAKANHAA